MELGGLKRAAQPTSSRRFSALFTSQRPPFFSAREREAAGTSGLLRRRPGRGRHTATVDTGPEHLFAENDLQARQLATKGGVGGYGESAGHRGERETVWRTAWGGEAKMGHLKTWW